MRKRFGIASMIPLFALSTMACMARADEEKIAVEKLPAADQEGHQEEIPQGRDREGHQGGRGRQDDLRGLARDRGPPGRRGVQGRRDHPGDREGDPFQAAPARVKKALAAKVSRGQDREGRGGHQG